MELVDVCDPDHEALIVLHLTILKARGAVLTALCPRRKSPSVVAFVFLVYLLTLAARVGIALGKGTNPRPDLCTGKSEHPRRCENVPQKGCSIALLPELSPAIQSLLGPVTECENETFVSGSY